MKNLGEKFDRQDFSNCDCDEEIVEWIAEVYGRLEIYAEAFNSAERMLGLGIQLMQHTRRMLNADLECVDAFAEKITLKKDQTVHIQKQKRKRKAHLYLAKYVWAISPGSMLTVFSLL